MANYSATPNANIFVRTSDGAAVPLDGMGAASQDLAAWLAGGGVPDPYAAPMQPQAVLSQDLMAQFTADDAAKIQAAVAGNVQFWLLWQSLTTQKDPMLVTNARFKAGWSALVSVLGQPRMDAIAAALGVAVTLP